MRDQPLIVAALLLSAAVFAGCRPAPQTGTTAAEAPSPVALRAEYKTNPLGIDTPAPRLSWRLESPERDVRQSAYQIRVAPSAAELRDGKKLLWDSGLVKSDQSVLRPYGGPALQSGRRYYWQVRVQDARGRSSAWSESAYWEMGLLDPQDWQAQWISPVLDEDSSKAGPAPMLRRIFRLSDRVQRGRVYVTSHGLYELRLNGKRVGDELFTPGWTSYDKRLQYQVYDVTELLQKGENALGVLLGDGWYRGQIGFNDLQGTNGEPFALLVQLAVTHADGRSEIVGSDLSWKSSTGPVLTSEIYDGESYDARLEKPGWDSPGYDDRDWKPVRLSDASSGVLVASAGPPVKRIEDIPAVKVFTTPAGEQVADFGQNLVGWVRVQVQGPAGTTVVLRHAEVLDAKGNFYDKNLRGAAQKVRYVLKGTGTETFEPHFSFQGFRYVAVEGYPGKLTPQSLTAVVIHSEMARTGRFETSSELLNRLQNNILWGQRGNFLDVPTDCPQRDERLGWTGDAQAFASTAAFNMDVAAFFGKWLADLSADQYPDGSVPFVIPDVVKVFEGKPAGGAAGWADAATVIPWEMYLAYGDRGLLERQYDSMAKWVDFQRQRAGDDHIWDEDFTFGDWLDYFGAAKSMPFGSTPTDLIGTAYFARSTDLLRRTAEVLGKTEDAARYGALFSKIAAAFARKFTTADGTVGNGTQTAYVLALQFDLLPEQLRAPAAAKLAGDVRRRGHLTTGFLGTPHLLAALSRYGYLDEAYMLLNREQYPSWLYPVTQGATTIWERWDGRKPDGSFQDASMNSFNHYAYGAVGHWMYRVVAGIDIDPAEPGYKHALIQPLPGGGLSRVQASIETQYGRLASAWVLGDGRFELSVDVPPNARATVRLPRAAGKQILESGKPLSAGIGIGGHKEAGESLLVEIGSGHYRFSYPWVQTNAHVGTARAAPAMAIEHVTVLSMTAGAQPLADMTVLIRGQRIEAIEPSADYSTADGTRTIDGTGKWLMPALTDMHVHLENPENATDEDLAGVLLPYVANGVLQIMDLAAIPESLRVRAAVESGRVLGPHMALAVMVDGSPPIWPEGVSRVAATPEAGRQVVRDIKKEGFDFVKVYSKLTPETFTAILAEARQQNLKVVGHIPGRVPDSIEKYLQPGFAMVAHAEEFAYQANQLSQEDIPRFAQLAKRNGTWLTSTLVLNELIVEQMRDLDKVMARPQIQFIYPPTVQETWVNNNRYAMSASAQRIERLSRVVDFNRKLVAAFLEAGVPVVAGTDSLAPGVIAGFSLHDELQALVAAGMTREQALAAATRLPAEWLGVTDDRGTAQVGKRADLLLLDADPLADIANTRRISAVIANGRYLSAVELEQMLADLAKRYKTMYR